MSKHTKGPWTARNTASNQVCVYAGPDKLICTLTRNAVRSERAENAYLISSAPELLSVLKNLTSGKVSNKARKEYWEQARKAVAKAEGNENE